jgi:hypothetical protein
MARTPENWRYYIMKKYRNRATIFYDKSKTTEQKAAWLEVINWFNSILKENRCITPSGAIGLKIDPAIECILQEDTSCSESGEQK